jgi:small conductance mechanosensitive channel
MFSWGRLCRAGLHHFPNCDFPPRAGRHPPRIIKAVSGIDVNKLWPEVRMAGERVTIGLAILAGFWIAGRITEYVVCRFRHRMPHNTGLLELLGRTTKIAILVFGFATAIGTMGVNVSALVAGLGLTGFALGFAFRDVLSNLLAGILLLLFRPFGIGDDISVTGLEGKGINIDLRYTILEQPGKRVLIPNSNLFTNPIIVNAGAVNPGSVNAGGVNAAADRPSSTS